MFVPAFKRLSTETARILYFIIMLRRSCAWQSKRARVCLAAPPSGGKGTISKYLVRDFGFHHLSTGDMLRDNVNRGTPLGKEVAAFMTTGTLVPDEIMCNLVNATLGELSDKHERLLLDGFPRRASQALTLKDLDLCLLLDVPDEEIVERVSLRRIHPPSNRTYHLQWSPPKVVTPVPLDDETGEPLVQRPDDTADAVRERLRLYHALTTPLVEQLSAQGTHVETFRGRESKKIYAEMRPFLEGWLKLHSAR
jgi:adenylate kinase